MQHALATLDFAIDAINAARPSDEDTADTLSKMGRSLRHGLNHRESGWYGLDSALKSALVNLRFVRLTTDEPDTDNPLYNATVWLVDALTHLTVVWYIDRELSFAERLAIASRQPPTGQ